MSFGSQLNPPTGGSGSSSPSSSTDHSSHGSSSSSSTDHGSAGGHSTIFQTGISTSLFSSAFTPKTQGQYAGTIIFLIVLAIVYRGLAAYKSVLEHRWAAKSKATVVVIAGKNDGEKEGLDKTVTKEEEVVPAPSGGEKKTMPWRISTELPRACLGTVNTGIGYLLMLAVMTMNVGYFMAVLAGYFVGDLVFGRWIKGESH